ncbi:MAG: cell division protein FtsA [Bacteroidetes bacterium]|uniref:Cell division protein FtsA n=1 Tax=Candidatus Cryptobacteroides intestinavium TaxID=2840766 RepID=A0A9D9EVW7_9BACT|nr:cell division protein FtsA [Candidatus Cryptobacteroides intestinavium]
MDERHLVAIDIGTSKIALTVAKVEGENVQIIYYRETPSAGIKYSRVINPHKAAGAIRQAVTTAEKELGISITDIIVGLPKYEVTQDPATLTVTRDADTCITQEEITGIKENALEKYPGINKETEMLFGIVAQSFGDEDEIQISENDIIGMAPEKLNCEFRVFKGQRKNVRDLRLAFRNAGNIHICREYFTPEAIAKAVLYDFEMENGVALIDLGAGVTSVTIYYDNIMRYYSAIPFGGNAITSDIRTECYITEKMAESIKLAYGACIPEKLLSLSDKTLLISSNDSLPAKQVTVKYLSEIITARETEIIEAILYRIQESGLADRLRSGIVITGGGANLLNVGSLIKDISGYAVRTGYARHIFSGADDTLDDTSVTASLGMILMAKNDRIDCLPERDGVQESAADDAGKAQTGQKASDPQQREESRNTSGPSVDDRDGRLFIDDPDMIITPKKRQQAHQTEKPHRSEDFHWTIGSLFRRASDTVKTTVKKINEEDL